MAEIAMTASMAVVGWFGVPILNEVLKKGYNLLSEDTNDKIRILETETLPGLKALIKDARMDQQQSNTLFQLLIQLKTIVYEAEDVIDKDAYELLVQQAMGKVEKVVSKVTFIPTNMASKWNKSGILKKLKAKTIRVNDFYTSLLNVLNHIPLPQLPTRTTTSVVDEVVFGRRAEGRHIVDILTTTPAMLNKSDENNFKVVAILGVGGVGKTVLARYVFHQKQIIDHFGPRMWVHVPQNFDEVQMTRSMVNHLNPGGSSFASNDLGELQTVLQKRLMKEKKKTFLLVLDDVWYNENLTLCENNARWSNLCAPLRCGGQGSMILITSRMEKVAWLFKHCVPELFFLKGLKETDCLDLFKYHAFPIVPPPPSTEQVEVLDLNKIAEEIVAEISTKLGGLPLAARAGGDLLKHNIRGWREIKRNLIEVQVRKSLMSSYQMLPAVLQHCIAHLSLYPRGFKFHPTSLALSWLGTGVVTEEKLEDVRYNYFDELVSRSFFQLAGDKSYVLHGLLHDVADAVSVHECMRITRNAENSRIPQTIKHLSIELKMLGQYKKDICKLKKLRTLFLTCSNNSCSDSCDCHKVDRGVLKAILKKTTRLRALSLASCCIAKLPKAVGDLTHLRFLDLSNSSVNKLPKTICKLYHLWYLNLKNCSLDDAPKDLNKLTNLSHLIVSDGATVLSRIPHIGRLTALQELKEFRVREESGHELRQLENLNLLQGALRVVNLENVAGDSEEAAKARLKEKSGLKELVLEWGRTGNDEPYLVPGGGPVAVLDKLRLPGEITNLTLGGYAGTDKDPSWVCVKPSHLKTLVLNNCPNRCALPPLGQLFTVVQELELRNCSELRYMRPLPPNLKKLVLYGCSKVAILTNEELQTTDVEQRRIDYARRQVVIEEGQVKTSLMEYESVMQDLQAFLKEEGLPQDATTSPPLTSLDRWVVKLKLEAITEKLNINPRVNHVQQLPTSLQDLQLHHCFVDDSTLSECLGSLISLSSLELSRCMCITSLPSNTVSSHLRRLKVLRVMGCVLLTSLGGIRELVSLEKFNVSLCPNFLAVVPPDDVGTRHGNAFLPVSLVDLRISDCGLLDDEKLSRCLMGLTRLTLLELHNCKHVTSLPLEAELGHLRSLKHLSLKTCFDLASVGGLHVLMTSLNYLKVEKCPKLLVPPTADVATALALPAIGATGDVILASANPITGTASATAPPTVGVVPTTPTPLTVAAALASPANGATSDITLASADLSAGTASAVAPPSAGVAATTPTTLTVATALAPPTIGATGAVTLASADPIVGTASTAAPPTACGVPTTPTPLTVAAALAPPTIGATSVVTLASADPIAGTASAAAPPTAGVVAATPTPLTAGTDVSTATTNASFVPDTLAPTGGAAFVADAAAIVLAPHTIGVAPAPPAAIGVLPFTCQVNVDNLSLLPQLLLGDRLASLKMLFIESPKNTAFTSEQQGCLGQLTSLQVLSFKNCHGLPSLPSNLHSLTSLKLLELHNCPQLRADPTLLPTLLPESLKFINLLDCHHELDQTCQQTLGDQVDVSFKGYKDYGDVID